MAMVGSSLQEAAVHWECDKKIALLERALRLAAGELSTYRDTDKHPQWVYDALIKLAKEME